MEQIMSMTKCCATCDYWMGSRKLFDSFGSRIVVNSRTDHGKCGCSSSGWSSSGETQGCFSCNSYRKWGVLK
ncbi:MAG: hypothetical protein K5761_00290 [Clostridiales bacterium]|nr:hypothetical protein [Clostridiales bacterium]